MGLAFSRSYTSANSMAKRTMGNGWSHNYDIHLTPTSHGEPGLGLRQPIDATSLIASLYVGYDILKGILKFSSVRGRRRKRVESRCGAVAFGLRFHIPLIEPDMRI